MEFFQEFKFINGTIRKKILRKKVHAFLSEWPKISATYPEKLEENILVEKDDGIFCKGWLDQYNFFKQIFSLGAII